MTSSAASQQFSERFAALAPSLPGSDRPWLGRLRAAGATRFAESGLPTVRDEAWKYTSLAPLEGIDIASAPASDAGPVAVPDPLPDPLTESVMCRLVFVNGWLRPDLSDLADLPSGVSLDGTAAALQADGDWLEDTLGSAESLDRRPLLALNTALMGDGYTLRLGPDVVLDGIVEVVHLTVPGPRPMAVHARNLVRAERGSRATVVERHLGREVEGGLVNGVTQILLEPGAEVRHVKVQDEGRAGFHLGQVQVRADRDARYESFVVTSGARLSRHEIHAVLAGTGAECCLYGVSMLGDGQHGDNTTVVEHAAAHTTSRQVYKGALDGKSRGVFQGRVVVHPDAQKSDGHQSCKTLLLSDRAEIDAKPELEIYADDVKCSHGAVAGELDEDALFYLRARGVPEREARNLLVEGFLDEVVDQLSHEDLRAPLKGEVGRWLAGRKAAS